MISLLFRLEYYNLKLSLPEGGRTWFEVLDHHGEEEELDEGDEEGEIIVVVFNVEEKVHV